MTTPKRAKLLHHLEQLDGIMSDLSPRIVAHYERMIDLGAPVDLAERLAVEYQRLLTGFVETED